MSEGRRQETEDRRQKPGDQRTEIRDQRAVAGDGSWEIGDRRAASRRRQSLSANRQEPDRVGSSVAVSIPTAEGAYGWRPLRVYLRNHCRASFQLACLRETATTKTVVPQYSTPQRKRQTIAQRRRRACGNQLWKPSVCRTATEDCRTVHRPLSTAH